ncbi:MAG: hypothetical protein WKF71_13150 [Pyrinomonadaceae bacterium]
MKEHAMAAAATVESKPVTKTAIVAPATNTSSGNITGKWKIETDVNGQAVNVEVDFKQDGGKLSGTLSSAFFAGGSITEGTLTGKKVKAKFMIDFEGEPLEVLLDGNLDGDGKMSGTLNPQAGGIGALPFTAVKLN